MDVFTLKCGYFQVIYTIFLFLTGSLVITLYGATALKKTVSEVYCVAQVDDAVTNRIRTSIGGCRSSVAWNECFEVSFSVLLCMKNHTSVF